MLRGACRWRQVVRRQAAAVLEERQSAASLRVLDQLGAVPDHVVVAGKAIFKPTANVFAAGASGRYNFGMAAAAAKVTRPATSAGFLPIHVPRGQECLPRRIIKTGRQ